MSLLTEICKSHGLLSSTDPDQRTEALASFTKGVLEYARLHVAMRWPRLRHLEDDVAHDTLAAVLDGLDSFKGESRVTTWLHGIAKHVASKYAQRARREKNLETASPVVSIDECRGDVQRLLNHLPPRQQQVIELLAQGFTRTEAAEELGVGASVVREHLSRARKRIAQLQTKRAA